MCHINETWCAWVYACMGRPIYLPRTLLLPLAAPFFFFILMLPVPACSTRKSTFWQPWKRRREAFWRRPSISLLFRCVCVCVLHVCMNSVYVCTVRTHTTHKHTNTQPHKHTNTQTQTQTHKHTNTQTHMARCGTIV